MGTATATAKFLGRCAVKGCKHTVRVEDSEMIREVWTKGGPWEPVQGEPRCADHPRLVLRWSRVQGVFNDAKVCTEKCMGATGPSCECECGGENHGGRHAL